MKGCAVSRLPASLAFIVALQMYIRRGAGKCCIFRWGKDATEKIRGKAVFFGFSKTLL